METWSDITDAFEILDQALLYVDGPIEGFMRRDEDGALFAFRCHELVHELVWHWVLVPIESTETSPAEVLERASLAPPSRWLSVVEDRRRQPGLLSDVWLGADRFPPRRR